MTGTPRDRGDGAEVTDAELAALALAAAHVGAQAITREARSGDLRVETKAHEADFVTAADTAAEHAVLSLLEAARPQDAVLAEESGERTGTSGIRWVIDPLDGTMNFVHGRHDYAVSVGAERDGRVAAGALVRPADGEWAVAGGGTLAARDGVPRVSSTTRLDSALVGVGLPSGDLNDQLRVHGLLMEVTRRARDFRRVGSSACEMLAVAMGRQDGYFGFGVNLWDVAAGIALVEAAGGVCEWVTTTSGLRVLVASAPGIADPLIKLAKAV